MEFPNQAELHEHSQSKAQDQWLQSHRLIPSQILFTKLRP